MKKFKVMLILILCVFSIMCIGCNMLRNPYAEEDGYFETDGWMGVIRGQETYLLGVYGNLEEQAELVIPTELNGFPVTTILGAQFDSRFLVSAKKVFIPNVNYKYPTLTKRIESRFPGKQILVFLSCNPDHYTNGFEDSGFTDRRPGEGRDFQFGITRKICVPRDVVELFRNRYAEYKEQKYFCAANVSYFYNYEEAPNEGYYWIDDLNLEDDIKTIPPIPTRDGYQFDGWYEKDAQAPFDFNLYRKGEDELELYANWLQIELP